MRRLALALLVSSIAACGGEDDELVDTGDAPDVLDDPEAPAKADAITSAVTIAGGLTLEDSTQAVLPAVPKYTGFVILAPSGAQLKVTASGGALATRVAIYGPRATNGSFGSSLASGVGSASLTAPRDGAYLAVPYPRYQGKSGLATVTVACTGTSCRGYCASSGPSLTRRGWVHSTLTLGTTAMGSPRHRAYDQVVGASTKATVRARFTYGGVDKDLEDEDVELWVRSCPGWKRIGTARTDDDGYAALSLSTALPKGDYKVLWYVPGDGSTAEGTLAVWEANRPVVVSDIDGTLTTNDGEIFKQVFLGSDPAMYANGDSALWILRRKGYRVVYLTGRPESLGRMTKGWLATHRFPPGLTKLTDETLEVLPTESGVGDFKTRYLEGLRASPGVGLFAALGNATTDISAYQANGLANDHTFIIGPHGGERGTTAVSAYSAILATLRGWPYASIP